MSTYRITYEFEFHDHKKFVYRLTLDLKTVTLIPERKPPLPPWTELEQDQCPPCTLTPAVASHCPIAANIAGLVEDFKGIQSTEPVCITVRSNERTYLKEASVQRGLSSIFGMIMATSNCPVMDFLKPMARFHLPFSTSEETIVRSLSMYLLHQYYTARKDGQPDFGMQHLDQAYSRVQKVNRGICSRIASAIRETQRRGDAASNAVIILDTFSHLLQAEIEGKLDSLDDLFGGLSRQHER